MNFGSDRTSDFLQVANTLRSSKTNGIARNGLGDHGVKTNRAQRRRLQANASSVSSTSQFASMAALISNDLAVTCSRLESLSSLARQRTLFDDHSAEVQHLTLLIKEDIANLNHRIADLQSLTKLQHQQQQSAKHSSSVLMTLQTRLAGMSERFKRVLEERSLTLRDQAARKNAFSARQPPPAAGGVVNPAFEPDSASNARQPVLAAAVPSILLEDEQRARRAVGSNQVVTDFAGVQHNEQMMTMYRDQTDNYLSARYDTVRTIEHTIVELGEIFQQLATMVHEQEESVERIDSNVGESVAAIESGHTELLRYLQSVSSNRWLMIKVFAILLAFFVFFVIFFV
uniref:t-SNARE coiled-coil homology domain-containing protein n=1 Tax=Mesocestoides corti TaxID=53468 RepID=A0A5K3FHK4_MESCO